MQKQFYVQTDSINRVTDIIEYQHEGYQPIMLTVPLPFRVLSGCYELIGDSLIYRKEWDSDLIQQRLDQLEQVVNAMTGGTTE